MDRKIFKQIFVIKKILKTVPVNNVFNKKIWNNISRNWIKVINVDLNNYLP